MKKISHERFKSLVMNEVTDIKEEIIVSISSCINTIHLLIADEYYYNDDDDYDDYCYYNEDDGEYYQHDSIIITDCKRIKDGKIDEKHILFSSDSKLELSIKLIAKKLHQMKKEFDEEKTYLKEREISKGNKK